MTKTKIALINRNAAAVWVVADSIDAAAAELSSIGGGATTLKQVDRREMENRLGADYYDAYEVPADMDPAAGDEGAVAERGEFLGHYESREAA